MVVYAAFRKKEIRYLTHTDFYKYDGYQGLIYFQNVINLYVSFRFI